LVTVKNADDELLTGRVRQLQAHAMRMNVVGRADFDDATVGS
jgi:hypothetical protein